MDAGDARVGTRGRGCVGVVPGQVPRAATGCPAHHFPTFPGQSLTLYVGPNNLQLCLQRWDIAVLLQCFRVAETELRHCGGAEVAGQCQLQEGCCWFTLRLPIPGPEYKACPEKVQPLLI